ncbi:proteasome activator pa28, REG alpha/beta subunit [Desarmillaria tabescens]|uniref:Proteasome activator pa28, REG alpha/beta subunit n=1 Tax=Armillaria tabescens TaxID=1929756 RepID=A0AA39TU17_ARMTA|nr:proteasome activator pa28, REG alpha/beta subunit [Desarmillaria tabescens]KAK0466408.1 proteasome activator pa28, REG alpha/beta subunit [Desarmillaria tabescens]
MPACSEIPHGPSKLSRGYRLSNIPFQGIAFAHSSNIVMQPIDMSRQILELQEMIQSFDSSSSPFHPSHAFDDNPMQQYTLLLTAILSEEPPNKKRRLSGPTDNNAYSNARSTNTVVANRHISGLHAIIKRECEQLSSTVDQVKMWITLTMPKFDRRGFKSKKVVLASNGYIFFNIAGSEVLSELHRAQESAYNLRDSARQDYITRTKLCSKLIKYPNVEDYTLALKEHDEKQIYFSRQHIIDIRNMYASLMDLIQKNITKIRAPKTNNSRALY